MIRHATTALLAVLLAAPAAAEDAPAGALLLCGDRAFAVRYAGGAAILQDAAAPNAPRELTADRTASGARHASVDGATWLWTRGREARLQIDGDGDGAAACRLEPLPLTARGTEPFWSLTLGPERMRFEALGAAPHEAATPAPEAPAAGLGWRFAASEAGLSLTLRPEICRNAMTGMPHPFGAEVETPQAALTGCAGAPADLIAGAWRVTEIGGEATPADADVTLEFDAEASRVSGASGCNSYVAQASLSGEGLSIPGPVAGTRMACDAPRMALEPRFLEALSGIDRFDLADDGDLLLISRDAPVIRARR